MTVITREQRPPIPQYSNTGVKLWWPWYAYHDGEEESGHYGAGDTEQEAKDDLKRLDDERVEAEQEAQWRHETGG